MLRPGLDPSAGEESLFDALIAARAHYGDKEILEDQDRKPLTYTGLIRAAFVLGRKIAAMTQPGERVGILLPASMGVVVTFFGLHAFGRVPTMLNFTAGEAEPESGDRCGWGQEDFVRQAVRRTGQDRRPDDRAGHGRRGGLAGRCAQDHRDSGQAVRPDGGTDAQAVPHADPAQRSGVVLFTSGSFGAPKGVLLSQKNLVANARQISTHIALDPDWVMFNPLPTFHCFGLTGGVILPILSGLKTFQYPSPLHGKQIVALLAEVRTSILFATDTFLNQWARVASPDDFRTLKFVVAGAERVRDETHHLFNTKFGGVKLLEGYGATEAAPVVAVNHPDRNRPGTVGQLLPGIEARLEAVEGIAEGRRLFLRGPNVMAGYMTPEDPTKIEPLEGGWHDTGDIVDLDDEGYIAILGRVKRFAKIGGEMVSLSAVEGLVQSVWPEARHAVIAIADSRKGEKLVLVTERSDAEVSKIAEWAREHGAPELAVPKKIVKVRELPVLGTGKTDYVAIQSLVDMAEAA